MFIVLRNITGKITQEQVEGVYTLDKAREEFENSIFTVVRVDMEEFGDFSNNRAASIIENEGVGYAVQSYCNWTEFSDEETRRLWKLADETLCALEAHVGV